VVRCKTRALTLVGNLARSPPLDGTSRLWHTPDMSVPQDSKTRRATKKRRTKKLAQWREKQQAQTTTVQDVATPKKRS
jgi:hypothetical protein